MPLYRLYYLSQSATIFERIIADACHTVRDSYASQAAAIFERIIADARHTVGDYKICNKLIINIQILCIM